MKYMKYIKYNIYLEHVLFALFCWRIDLSCKSAAALSLSDCDVPVESIHWEPPFAITLLS